MVDRVGTYVQVLQLVFWFAFIRKKTLWILDIVGLKIQILQIRTNSNDFIIVR